MVDVTSTHTERRHGGAGTHMTSQGVWLRGGLYVAVSVLSDLYMFATLPTPTKPYIVALAVAKNACIVIRTFLDQSPSQRDAAQAPQKPTDVNIVNPPEDPANVTEQPGPAGKENADE